MTNRNPEQAVANLYDFASYLVERGYHPGPARWLLLQAIELDLTPGQRPVEKTPPTPASPTSAMAVIPPPSAPEPTTKPKRDLVGPPGRVSMAEAAKTLQVDPETVRRWAHRVGMKPERAHGTFFYNEDEVLYLSFAQKSLNWSPTRKIRADVLKREFNRQRRKARREALASPLTDESLPDAPKAPSQEPVPPSALATTDPKVPPMTGWIRFEEVAQLVGCARGSLSVWYRRLGMKTVEVPPRHQLLFWKPEVLVLARLWKLHSPMRTKDSREALQRDFAAERSKLSSTSSAATPAPETL